MSNGVLPLLARAARAMRWLVAGGLLAAFGAHANQVFTTDCAFDIKEDFGVDEIVCASGDVDTKPPGFIVVFPEGNVCVVRAGTLTAGGGIGDVTAGGCNTVVGTGLGGGFFDEPIWLPPLQRGLFQVVLDEDQDGVFGGLDFAGNFFRVGDPVGANVDVAAIKGAAAAQFDHWDGLAQHWHWVSDASTAISIAWAASSGDWVSVGVSVFGAITGIPTDYNGAVLNLGGKVIEGLAAQQARRYKGLRDDPPDPAFDQFAALDMAQVNAELAADAALFPGVPLAFPFTPRGSSAFERAQLAVANHAALQSGLVGALTTTIEKLQGAQAAGNDEYIAQQARALQGYADELVANLGDTKQALQDYQAAQTVSGLAATTYSAAEIGALVARINATGLTAAEVDSLAAAGFRAADIDFLRARVAALAAEVPAADYTRGQTVADLITAADAGIAAFQALSAEAAAVVADREPFVILSFPTARAGGPYAGVQGAAIALSGAASTDPNGDALTHAWDFDLDGSFDDAVGVAVNYVPSAVGSTRVGLRVTDPSGRSDVAYAVVDVAAANRPPVIDSFAPASLAPVASPSSPLAFSVAASDPDGDPLGYAWTVEGVAVGAGAAYVYTPAPGETGTRIVR
ncbi:MAG TPA: PKD domain-containing protein, partial [Rubrivivax sp.]|nr:PKD domain-containing protein [Rubrivivax sp.]